MRFAAARRRALAPEVDRSSPSLGDSFRTNLGVDTVLTQSLMPANLLYVGGHDLSDPYVSPLFGDFAKGFRPLCWRPKPATFFYRTPSECTGRCVEREFPPSCTFSRPHHTAGSSVSRPKTPSSLRRYGASSTSGHSGAGLGDVRGTVAPAGWIEGGRDRSGSGRQR